MARRVIAFIDGAYGRDRTARQGDAMTPRDAARPTDIGSSRSTVRRTPARGRGLGVGKQSLGDRDRLTIGASDANGDALGPGQQLLARQHGVHHAHRPSLVRRQKLAGREQPQRGRRTEQPRQALRAAPRRAVAELVVDEAQLRTLRRDPPVAGQAEVDAAAHRVAVQDRDRGNRQRRDPVTGAAAAGRNLDAVQLLHAGQVGSGREQRGCRRP